VPEEPEPSPPIEEWSPSQPAKSERARSRKRGSLKHRRTRTGPLWRLVYNPWFEPLVTVLAVLVVLLALYAYTGNWPPLVVVESQSMQHGLVDTLGVINTGDLVLVKKISGPSQVVTYVDAEGSGPNSGYSTYGELGDVLLYFADGDMSTTPIIHRAILWLSYDPAANEYIAPSLANLTCGSPRTGAAYQIGKEVPYGSPIQSPSCPNADAPISGDLYLYRVGWQSVTIVIDLNQLIRQATLPLHSGFITEGDDNCEVGPSCTYGGNGTYDQGGLGGCAITCNIVDPSWVEGVARGMIPWFGAIKLWLSGDPQNVPPQTWEYLALTILAIVLLPTVLPRVIRSVREGRRKGQGQDGADGEDGELPASDEDEDEAPEPAPDPL
jgi:signal peptidase I